MYYQLNVSIKHIKPLIWRRLVVPATVTLDVLHDAIQIAFGWEDYHLHVFNVAGQSYGVPDPEFPELNVKREEKARLDKLISTPKTKILYEYDFGDGWEHEIVLEKLTEAAGPSGPVSCIGGARACPPEDCGGPHRYGRLMQILKNPKHPEYDDMSEWLGEEFDAEEFNLQSISKELEAYGREL